MNRFLFLIILFLSFHVFAQDSNGLISSEFASEKQAEAYIYDIYRATYNGKESTLNQFETEVFDKLRDPYPYIYALWFNSAVVGDYGKKTHPHQLKIIEKILADPNAIGTVKTGANYQKSFHYLKSNELAKAKLIFPLFESLRDWQFVGPFENISHSGFNKDFGPLTHAESKSEFISNTKAKVTWFTPAYYNPDGWTAIPFHFNENTAVIYGQTFIDSPIEQEVYCAAGAGGALKIWINDAIIHSDETERATEVDAFVIKTKLKKGTNRLLVQLSFTENNFANYCIRLTDKNLKAITNIKSTAEYRPYEKQTKIEFIPIKHFAETFFLKKIEEEPSNPVNYLLLVDTYLRNKKLSEAHELAEKALVIMPSNLYLRMKSLDILVKEGNRTRLLEELSVLRQMDPDALVIKEIDINNHIANQQWEDALIKIDQQIKSLGEDPEILARKMNVFLSQKRYKDFLELAENLYREHPENINICKVIYAIKREVNHDVPGALKVYEDYLTKNYDYSIYNDYSKALIANGQVEKGTSLSEKLIDDYPHETELLNDYAEYNYIAKNYDKAEMYIQKALKNSPYQEICWALLGDIKKEQLKTTDAINAYNKSLLYNPNQYQVINKIRQLKGKSESQKILNKIDADAIAKTKTDLEKNAIDAGYVILLDEKNIIIHPSGAFQEFDNYIIKIVNETGVDEFKESSIKYNNNQTLLIEQAELIKPSGAHIRADRNQNSLVFTNLEIGDVIVFRYNFKNYISGRFADQFWDKVYFNDDAPIVTKRYNLLAPTSKKINFVWSNNPIKPVIKDVEDFKQYTWEVNNVPAIVGEPYMPAWADIAHSLHITTLNKWQDISSWYSDIANQYTNENQEVKNALNRLFTEQERIELNQFQKAEKIYSFILNNIRYSSVSFRQGAFVPQPAFITLTTRLGDCKDLSNLFITLCQMVGIEGRMVLVNTLDNGAKSILLPSIDFNHCIAKVNLDNKEYYIELTDRYLPFTSLPNNIHNSLILEIPRKNEVFTSELKNLNSTIKHKDIVNTSISIKPENNDLIIKTKSTRHGNLASLLRSSFAELSSEKQFSQIEKSVAQQYKNNIILEEVSDMANMNDLADSASYGYTYRVKDEIAEIGSMRTFKLSNLDNIVAISDFPSNTRTYPVNYNAYENTDIYKTKIIIEIPKERKFIEIPTNESFSFREMNYSLQFKVIKPNLLEITRHFNANRSMIPETEYTAFRNLIEKIVKAETKMIVYQ